MSIAILSIKKRYTDAILSGLKKCELRKSPFPKNISTAIIYSSNHTGLITGWFAVKTTVESNPEDIWKRFSKDVYINKEEFDKYYEDATKAICLVIDSYHKLDPPIDPSIELTDFSPPQSFMYLRKADWPILEKRINLLQRQMLETHFGNIVEGE